MQSKQLSQIKRALRELWVRSPQRHEAIRSAKESILIGSYKNGRPIMRMHIKCAQCQNLFPILGTNTYQVDHIVPVEPSRDMNEYVAKLFCEADNLQVLCLTCHNHKTKQEKVS